jgi:transposase
MVNRAIISWHLKSEVSRQLETIPGIGVLTATAIVMYAGVFKLVRQVAAWIGLTPQLNETGGKVGLGRISKGGRADPWINGLLAPRPVRPELTNGPFL